MSDFQHPHPQPMPQQPSGYVVAQKSKFLAALLAFFFGTLGIHNFYLGYNVRGFVQLAMGLVGYATTWLLIGFVILLPLGIWVIIELLLLLFAKEGRFSRSANGVPLS